MPSEQSIQKFREIYRSEFGVEISQEEAAKQATRFLSLARIVTQPMPKAWLPRYQELLKEHETENHDKRKDI